MTGKDHVSAVQKLAKKIVGTKSPWTVSCCWHILLSTYYVIDCNLLFLGCFYSYCNYFVQTLAALHRQLRMLTPLFIIRDPNKKEKLHPRTIFLFNDMLVVSILPVRIILSYHEITNNVNCMACFCF